jgi:hypothetical protein
MLREESWDVAIKLKLITANNTLLQLAVCVLGFVPIGLLADLREEDMDITIPFTTCASDALKLYVTTEYRLYKCRT